MQVPILPALQPGRSVPLLSQPVSNQPVLSQPAWIQPLWIMGLMSGTSMDGIDAALLRTDGEAIAGFGPALTLSYPEALRAQIRGCLGGQGPTATVSRALTAAHADAVRALLGQARMAAGDIAWLGFHGPTLLHRPAARPR